MTSSGAMARRARRGPFAHVAHVGTTGSTNADLVAALRLPEAGRTWPHLAVLVAEHQADGRGRAGRTWSTPAGSALTASVVLRPAVALQRWSWLSLLGGVAVTRALRRRTGLDAALKWPNDVLVGAGDAEDEPGWGRHRKVAGVLVEVARPGDDAAAAVLGFGVNLHQEAGALPVPWATSLAAAGVPRPDRDAALLLDAIGTEIVDLLDPWEAAAGDAERSGLLSAVTAACLTLGSQVRVTLPGAGEVTGRAVSIAADGALVVQPASGTAVRVTAGDVGHLRVGRV